MNILPFALSAVRQHWRIGLFAIVLLALTLQTFRLGSTQGALEAETAGRRGDAARYAQAQAETAAIALTAKMKKEAEYAAHAEQADARADDLGERYHAAVLRWKAAQRSGRATDLPGTTESAESADRSGGSPVIPLGNILIPEADAFVCAANTARLQAAREWALSLEVQQ